MENVLPFFSKLLADDGFFKFQNDVAQKMYGALDQGYAHNEKEVALVTRLVDAVNGMHYGGVSLHTKKIHGTRSYVEFNHQGRPITKELADSVFITVVTRKRRRLLQRVCLVQNKVAKNGGWQIDQGQLYLLKNFPVFSGSRGLFRGRSDVVFRNIGGTLGAFGLFQEPGEMTLITAPLLADLSRGGSSLKADALSVPEVASGQATAGTATGGPPWLPWSSAIFPPNAIELFHELHRFYRHHPGGPWPWLGISAPFLARSVFMRDLHDLARSWLLVNVGEFSFVLGAATDPALDAFAASLLRAAGAQQFFDIDVDTAELDTDLTVFIAQIEVGEG
ncbi:hypothetical protein FBQ97_10165 [Acidobacteria bacterium ACD]|nr:MAG: hypothetical protein EDX89_21385 [Acidobacteriota bacterium]MCE7956429.1 hypothetical protein [Acidobacteria bacterium ACB2]MDL1950163.1 hypothetical protein [Acidobacteria bacterium ACD]